MPRKGQKLSQCKRGHVFTSENVRITKKGSQQCLDCAKMIKSGRNKLESLEEICSTIRPCCLCGEELLEHTIHKSSALWKRWYVCKLCYSSKIKKRYKQNRTDNPLKHKAMILRRPLVFSDISQAVMEQMITDNLGKPCFHCGNPLLLERISPDHKIPSSKGGSNNKDNIRLICRGCNIKKGSLSEDDFVKLKEILLPHPEISKAVMDRMGNSGFAFRRRG